MIRKHAIQIEFHALSIERLDQGFLKPIIEGFLAQSTTREPFVGPGLAQPLVKVLGYERVVIHVGIRSIDSVYLFRLSRTQGFVGI